jgi:hypothetical protein
LVETPAGEAANASIAEWGDALRWAIRREDRARLDSTLFDVQRRQIIGYECYYALAPQVVRELQGAGLTPARVAAEMRRLMKRPYLLQIFELIINPLLAREQRLLSGDEVAGFDALDLPVLAQFVSSLVREYRADDQFGPTAGNNDRQLILEPDDIERCRDGLVPVTAESVRALRKAFGTIGLYSVLLHGEHRDGIFDHGPYPGPDGTSLLVSECNDIANDYLPWSTDEVRLSTSALAIVYAYRDVRLTFGLFGDVATDPIDFATRVERAGVLAVRDGEFVALSPQELDQLVEETRAATRALYSHVVQWEDAERVLYGTYLYANHLRPFTRMLDEHLGGGRGDNLIRRFEAIGKEVGAGLVGQPLPTVAGYAADASVATAPFFSPLTTT